MRLLEARVATTDDEVPAAVGGELGPRVSLRLVTSPRPTEAEAVEAAGGVGAREAKGAKAARSALHALHVRLAARRGIRRWD